MQLHDYQVKALEGLPKNVILAWDVGLGKTIGALEHARRHEATHIVVVAPASKVRTGDWHREIERFFKNAYMNRSGWQAILDGDSMPEDPLFYEVISYEMFAKRWKEFTRPDQTIIFDEMHFICNATAKRSKAAIKVALAAKQWIGLSATSLPNGWRSAETYSILTGLSRNKTEFVNRFVIIDRSRGFPLILGYRETILLEKWWATIAKPLERTGDMHLPSQSFATVVPMEGTLLKTYNKAIKQRLITVDGENELLDNPSKLFVTLRKIPTPVRVNALQSIVESTNEHIIVFYNFNVERDAVLEMLAKNFKERTVYEQSGHASDLPPREKWGNLKPSVTIAQYQSASQAIELTYASVTVYLSPCTSYANYEQSKGRTKRNGQEKTTLFYHVAAEGSLDKHIWGIIKQKRDFSTDLMQKLLD